MRREATTLQVEELLRSGLTDRQFRRRLYALEHGPHELERLDLRNRFDVTAKFYRDALTAARARLRDRSLTRNQLVGLVRAFRHWRAAAEALAAFDTARRLPPAAAE